MLVAPAAHDEEDLNGTTPAMFDSVHAGDDDGTCYASRIVSNGERSTFRFVMRFSIAIAVLYLLIAWKPVDEHVVVPLTARICQTTAALLRAWGEPVDVSGTVIRSAGFGLNVKNGCNGVEAVLILVAAVIAFPAPAKMRLIGIVAGIIVIQVLNLVRIASLVWLGTHHLQVLDLFHVAIWQTLIILASVGIFLVWSGSLARPGASANS